MPKYRPTAEDKRVIRRFAERAANRDRVMIRPLVRTSTANVITAAHRGRHVNVRLISDDPDWNDTDLFDVLPWSEFVSGVELTADGRGVVDMAVYERDRDGEGELRTHVQAYIEGGRLVRVAEQGTTLWEAA